MTTLPDDPQHDRSGDRELHELLAAVCDDALTAEQAARLSGRLRKEPAAQRFYVRYLDMHARLLGLPGMPADARPKVLQLDASGSTLIWRSIGGLGMPLAVVAATVLAIAILARRPAGDREPPPAVAPAVAIASEPSAPSASYVATIASASPDARLDDRPVFVGGRLLPVSSVRTAGSLTIRFDGGAEIFFDTGSRFRITSRRSLEVEEGAFVFQGDATCEPLAITTPQATLVDVGTHYAAVVRAGAEELHVLDGAVRRSTDGPEELLTAGVGRAYDEQSPRGRVIPIDAAFVQRRVRAAGAEQVALPPDAADRFSDAVEAVHGLSGGWGWRGAWIAQQPRSPFDVACPGLELDGSGAIVHRGGGSRAAHRLLEQPIDLGANGVRYVRYLVRREADLPGDVNLAMLVLRKHGLTVEEELGRQSFIQLAIQRDDTVTLKCFGKSIRSSAVLPPESTIAVVAKLVSGFEHPDQIFLRVMPVSRLGDREPQDWTAVSESIATDLVLDQVSVEVVSRGTVWIDDIAIGPTWASIAIPRGDAP